MSVVSGKSKHENEGYGVSAVSEFADVASQVERSRPDLILLDLGLPGLDGFALCKGIRKASRVPIMFVTSRDSSLDELKALSLGGDDYITKPYNIPVLLARIKAVLRRSTDPSAQAETIEINGLRLDMLKAVLEHDGKTIEATKNEIKILACLMRRPGEIVSRADLIEYLWDNQVYIDDNTLSVNMTRLRAKLDELGLKDYIATKRGMGYKV
jgi:DNA-binding response OmpR family regulator